MSKKTKKPAKAKKEKSDTIGIFNAITEEKEFFFSVKDNSWWWTYALFLLGGGLIVIWALTTF